MVVFRIGQWRWRLIESIGTFRALDDLVTNQDTLQYHVKGMQVMTYVDDDEDSPNVASVEPDLELQKAWEQSVVEHRESDLRLLLQQHVDGVIHASEVYRRQMVVLIVTYVEQLLVEFMEALFACRPATMYDYLQDASEARLRGKVDLRDVLSAGSKDELIGNLARRAASLTARGKFETSLVTIEKVSRSRLDAALRRKLIELVRCRNRIVHETTEEEVTRPDVEMYFDIAFDFIDALALIASDGDIPYDDPSVSPFSYGP